MTRRVWLFGGLAAVAIVIALVALGSSEAPPNDGASAAAPSLVSAPAAEPSVGCKSGNAIYVASNGAATNDGTLDKPLDLTAALAENGPAKPCDTVWLRGGTYKGAFTSNLKGQPGSPIVVRNYSGERVTIDSDHSSEPALTVKGSWVWFWGLELMSSDPQRRSVQPGAWPEDLHRGSGVDARGTNLKFINLVVHDLLRGINLLAGSIDTEAYGNVVYNNGWEGPNRAASGYGIFTQSQVGSRRISENIVYNQYSHGIYAFNADQMTLEGNVVFNNGILQHGGALEREVLVGGERAVQNPVLRANATYGGQINVGYGAGCSNATIVGNYLSGAPALLLNKCAGTITGNTFHGGGDVTQATHPDNTFQSARPTDTVTMVRRNKYEPGRAHIVVYNWKRQGEVTVDLSTSGLASGDEYEIRDAQNYYGKAVASGTYGASTVTLPMTGLTVATPVGDVANTPSHTSPDFAVFVIEKRSDRSRN